MKPALKLVPRSPCAISNVLDCLGDKWSLLIVRDLIFYEKHEYKEFLASPESIATNILSDRLRKLLSYGIVAECIHPESKSRKFYYLTEKGKGLLPILVEMVIWADRNLPASEIMKPVATAIERNRKNFLVEIISKTTEWEMLNLPKTNKMQRALKS
ncbi:MAG: helix-turn-helix transcriptional regulator [Leptolyngbya sp.]|nr:helix-turn-helix transcriptional regulator [Candidatus Melainabacteria bacterium]